MKLVIGLVGGIGSGKTSVSEYLSSRYGASQHRFSQILMDILDRLYLPHRREYLQKLGASLRAELGMDVIVNAFKKDLEKDPSDLIVIDGIRYENEVEMLRSFENNLLIFITAPVRDRYERIVVRGEKDEAAITFAEFLESEMRETERYIDVIGKKADYVIENTGTLEELYAKVDAIMRERGVSAKS
jgi:dephospho-CoA kinase